MKVPVLVDLPDGWELADEEMRLVKEGEWVLGADGEPYMVTRIGSPNRPEIILRRKLSPTVKVELPREDAKFLAEITDQYGSWERLSAACREALKAEQGT